MPDPATAPARPGFRRWYGRQLFESYAWLATCLLSGVVFGAVLELVGLRTPGIWPYVTLVVLYLVGLLAVVAFRRFWTRLARAQAYADRATCARCGTYGLFEFVEGADAWPARCRRCGHEWRIG